jgi:type IX secretion system PorP/SprF family membrane protein
MKPTAIRLSLMLLMTTGILKAQQDPAYLFYRYNMNFINPAYAGAESVTSFGANIRSQWSGVAGAPETQSFFASTQTGERVGLGVSIINDQTFIEKQTAVAIDFSYMVPWNETTTLYLGLKASGNSYNANTAGLTTFGIGSDPSLMDLDGGITPNIGAGAYVQGRKFSLALSIPNILKPERLEQEGGSARLGRSRTHMYLMGAYDLSLNETWTLKPSSMLRLIEDTPFSIDLTLLASYQNLLEFGAAYRWDEGIAGLVFIDLGKGFRIGYAYEVSVESGLNQSNNGTHEVFVNLQL